MKIKHTMIDKELRLTGFFLRGLPYLFNGFSLKLLSFLSKNLSKVSPSDSIVTSEQWISREDGSRFRVVIFKSKNHDINVPGILWFHGGGYAIGSPKQTARIAKLFIERKTCVVISPEYRLSTEAPYPAALEDCFQTLVWIKKNSHSLGINDNQIMVGGESAGGGLAVALSFYARDKHEDSISFLMPLYPMIDDRMIHPSSKNNNAPVWNSKSNESCWKLYLNKLYNTDNIPIYAAPSRATNFNNLPPTITFVGDLEPFKDEVIEYVDNLRKAGMSVDFKLFKGCYHAFEQVCPNAQVSQEALEFLMKSYQYATDNYFAQQKL